MTERRARIAAQLQEHGERRRAARLDSQRELEAIAKLLPAALDAGMTKAEIARLARVSRPTIDTLLKRR